MEIENTSFIFYLTLEDNLPKNYYVLDEKLKKVGFTLMPIKVDQLQAIISASMQEHVVILCSVSTASEYKLYNLYIRKYVKNAFKSKRTSFFLLSSFSKLNDKKSLGSIENYYFLKYPVCSDTLALQLCNFHMAKSTNSSLWPGGRRVTMENM